MIYVDLNYKEVLRKVSEIPPEVYRPFMTKNAKLTMRYKQELAILFNSQGVWPKIDTLKQ